MTTKDLRALLEDLADRTRPAELAAPALRKARRIRARRWGLAAIAAVVALALPFVFVPRAGEVQPEVSPAPSGPVPVVMPGGWVVGNLSGKDDRQTWVYDRVQGRYRLVPYAFAVPAPVGDLVFVERWDGSAGVLNLRTGGLMEVTKNRFMDWSINAPEWSADGKRLLRLARFGRAFITDAVTGVSREIPLEGGPCRDCLSIAWLPGEREFAAYSGLTPVNIYSAADGRKLRTVTFRPWAQSAFSPDGTRVLVEEGIVEVATGAVVAPVPDSYLHANAYWVEPDRILLIGGGAVIVYSAGGERVDSFPVVPAGFVGGRQSDLTRLVKV